VTADNLLSYVVVTDEISSSNTKIEIGVLIFLPKGLRGIGAGLHPPCPDPQVLTSESAPVRYPCIGPATSAIHLAA
jgi:hypothetical protein